MVDKNWFKEKVAADLCSSYVYDEEVKTSKK